MVNITRIIVVVALKLTAGKINPSILAPGKLYAPIEKSTMNFGRKKKKIPFKINETDPKVKKLIGRRINEKKGLTIKEIRKRPPIISTMFFGLAPRLIVGTSV